MEEQIWRMDVAGWSLRYLLRDPATARYFRGRMTPCGGTAYDIAADETQLRRFLQTLPERSTAYVECKLLILYTAQYLLRRNACVFHAVAFAWRGMAWLLTGPSGVGKSTQFALWRDQWGDEIEMICGDMPVISAEPNGAIRVHPSPWNGKEGWYGHVSAPLGGIIVLEQADENTVARLTPAEALRETFRQFQCYPETEEEIKAFAALIDRTLSGHPVWKLRNLGDPASAALTRQTLASCLSERRQHHETI